MESASFYVAAAAWSQVVASFLFMAVLVWMWFKWIQPAILTAQANANAQVAEAERHRDEAKAALDLLKRETNGASQDAAAIKARAAEQAKREYDAVVADAVDAGERALRGAAGELDRARVAARDQLRVELLEKALGRARAEAERRVDDKVNAELVERFIGELGNRKNG